MGSIQSGYSSRTYPRTLTWRTAILIASLGSVAVWQHFGGKVGFGDLVEVVRRGTPEAASSSSFSGQVTRVADGDTFTLNCCRQRVRLWGIDAPEWDEVGGSAATDALRPLISGQTLSCALRDVDRYGRLVGQCVLPDGRDLGAAMLATGTVDEYCRYSGNFYGRC